MDTLFVLSIDIGILNLGYVYANINFPTLEVSSKIKSKLYNKNYFFNKDTIKDNINVLSCDRVDITSMKHTRVNRRECTLCHDNCVPDYLDHFIQENEDLFHTADIIILERQPPVGITNVQDLLFRLFRNKVLLISPNSVHAYFNLPKEYTVRKERSEELAKEYIFLENFQKNIRKHDISDALLMIIYYYKTKIDEIIDNTTVLKLDHDFDQFRFKL